MSSSANFLFLSVLLFCLTFNPTANATSAAHRPIRTHIRLDDTGFEYIQPACENRDTVASQLCDLFLQDAPPNLKTSALGLTIYALRYAEKWALNISAEWNLLLSHHKTDQQLPATFTTALKDCVENFYPVIETEVDYAMNNLLMNAYSDALVSTNAALDAAEKCFSGIKPIAKDLKYTNVEEARPAEEAANAILWSLRSAIGLLKAHFIK